MRGHPEPGRTGISRTDLQEGVDSIRAGPPRLCSVRFFGKEDEVKAQIEKLPKLSMKVLRGENNTVLRIREDIPLLPKDDELFSND